MTRSVVRAIYRRFLYPTGRLPDPRPLLEDTRVLRLSASDGADVHALALGDGAAGTIVFFHGNGETAQDVVPLARLFVERGFSAVVVEYRGYGISKASGPPTEEGLYADAEAVLANLAAQGARSSAVILWGTSLGTGVAIEMARRGRAACLVLSSPYTSILAVAQRLVPIVPGRWIVTDVYDSLAKAREVNVPVLVVHGERDRLIPVAMGRALAAALPDCRFESVARAGHNDVFAVDGDRLVALALEHIGRALASAAPQAP